MAVCSPLTRAGTRARRLAVVTCLINAGVPQLSVGEKAILTCSPSVDCPSSARLTDAATTPTAPAASCVLYLLSRRSLGQAAGHPAQLDAQLRGALPNPRWTLTCQVELLKVN